MKSQRQSKFEAAVLRRLFNNSSSSSASASDSALSSPLPPPPPVISSPSLDYLSTQGLQSQDLESQDEQENDGGHADYSDKTSGDEAAEATKTSLTRAQRKRLKIKRLKEAKQKGSAQPGRFIGPLRPADRSHLLTDDSSFATDSPHNRSEQSIERNILVEEDYDCILLSKSKRRKLAKKKKYSPKDQSRNPYISVFTADVGECGYIIKKGPLIG